MKLFIGIDVNPKTFDVAILITHEPNPIFQGSFDDDLTVTTKLKAIILKFNKPSILTRLLSVWSQLQSTIFIQPIFPRMMTYHKSILKLLLLIPEMLNIIRTF